MGCGSGGLRWDGFRSEVTAVVVHVGWVWPDVLAAVVVQ